MVHSLYAYLLLGYPIFLFSPSCLVWSGPRVLAVVPGMVVHRREKKGVVKSVYIMRR